MDKLPETAQNLSFLANLRLVRLNVRQKQELGGRSRAKAGIMQRISMVALRATARQVIRGVALVGAANVQAHNYA